MGIQKVTVKTQLMDILLEKFPDNKFNYTDITKTIVEDIKGMTYDKHHRGYYGTNISNTSNGYLSRPSKKEPRFLNRVKRGEWQILTSDNRPKVWFFDIRIGIMFTGIVIKEGYRHSVIMTDSGKVTSIANEGILRDKEEVQRKKKDIIEKEHGYSFRQYIIQMREIGEEVSLDIL